MIPVLLTVSPVRDADGAVVGGSTVTRDMTKEKEVFDAARSMIESSLDALEFWLAIPQQLRIAPNL